MEREQTKEIIKIIKLAFGNKFVVDDPKSLVDTWHRFLKDYEFNMIYNNLELYIKNNQFAPSIADLIKPPKVEMDRYVPTAEETKLYLDEQERIRKQVLNDPKVEEAREKAQLEIRRILGIRR
jgi:hypothetical protein